DPRPPDGGGVGAGGGRVGGGAGPAPRLARSVRRAGQSAAPPAGGACPRGSGSRLAPTGLDRGRRCRDPRGVAARPRGGDDHALRGGRANRPRGGGVGKRGAAPFSPRNGEPWV